MSIRPLCAALCFFAVVLPAAPTATADGPKAAHEAAVRSYVDALRELIAWCKKNKLYGKRDEVCEVLLHYAPDDALAREKLRYKRAKDGTWTQHPKYKRADDWYKSRIPEYEERRRAVDAGYRDAVVAAFDACTSVADLVWAEDVAVKLAEELADDPVAAASVPRVRRTLYVRAEQEGNAAVLARVEHALLEGAPDDESLRKALGHARHGERWVLAETARTFATQAALAAAAKEALAAAGTPAVDRLTENEHAVGMAQLEAYALEHMRAVGTGKQEDLEHFASACEAAGPFFEQAVGRSPKRRPQNTAYLFAEDGEVDTFLARYPVKDSPLLQAFKELDLHITWIDGRTMMAKKNPPDAQLDLALNMLFTVMLSDTFFGSKDLKGWLDEGISRHLTYRLVGSRLSVGLGGRYGDKQKSDTRHVPESKDSWLKAAHAKVAKDARLDLRFTLTKGIDAFTVRDSLLSYAFAVYLLEGRPTQTAPFLHALGKGKELDAACREAFGLPLAVVEVRMRRWLAEMVGA